MSGARRQFGPALVIIGAIVAIAAGLVLVAAILFPTESSQAGLGLGNLVESVRHQLDTLGRLTGLSPLADVFLLAAAYIMVCICLWIQHETRMYFTNRSHFE